MNKIDDPHLPTDDFEILDIYATSLLNINETTKVENN